MLGGAGLLVLALIIGAIASAVKPVAPDGKPDKDREARRVTTRKDHPAEPPLQADATNSAPNPPKNTGDPVQPELPQPTTPSPPAVVPTLESPNDRIARLCVEVTRGKVEARRAAVRELAELGVQANRAVPVVSQAIQDADQGVRLAAADALPRMVGDPAEALPGFIEGLTGTDPLLKKKILGHVAAIGGTAAKDAGPAIHSLLGEEALRSDVFRALLALGKSEVPWLREKLSDQDVRVRKGAIQSLAAFGPDAGEAVADLATFLGDGELRNDVMLALGKVGKPAVGVLTKSVETDSGIVQQGAIQALGYIGPDAASALDQLSRVAREATERKTREIAEVAIKRIRAK